MTKISTLENGLRIVTHNMSELETIAMGIWNNVGGRDELENVIISNRELLESLDFSEWAF